jgi:hypothetical protein
MVMKSLLVLLFMSGEHPDLQRAAAQPSGVLFPLPDKDPQRPHVFMDITIDGKPAGVSR